MEIQISDRPTWTNSLRFILKHLLRKYYCYIKVSVNYCAFKVKAKIRCIYYFYRHHHHHLNYTNCLVFVFCLCVFCYFFFTRDHFVIGLRAVKLACN
jgi:hypothetical protein